MSKTYKHDETGKVQELSDAVAKLFPAFKPVDVTDQTETVAVSTIAPALVQDEVVSDADDTGKTRQIKREVAS